MKTFEQLTTAEQELALNNQLTYFANLVTHEDYPGMALFLGVDVYARVRVLIKEAIRLAAVDNPPLRAPERVADACAAELSAAASERARRAFYREPGDLVYDIRSATQAHRGHSSGAAKLRLLKEDELEGVETLGQKVYGVFLHDAFLVARVRCVAQFPARWQVEDMQGHRLSPISFWDMSANRQRRKVREWAITHVNERVKSGAYDYLIGMVEEEDLTGAHR